MKGNKAQALSLTPLFVAFIGWLSLWKQLDVNTVLGIIACVVGIIFTSLAVNLV
ncbi:MAG: EamA family transporter [Candidatus Thorarchaeota archaeon]